MVQDGMVRVVVIHGDCFLRNALIEWLGQERWIEVCAMVSEIEEVREVIGLYRPHVLVSNVSLKCSTGFSSLRKLKRDFPGLGIVAFSCDSELENVYVGQALRAGADGYISSNDSPEDLVLAIRSACSGREFLSSRVRSQYPKDKNWCDGLAALSRREAEVFCLTGCGYATRRIAERMGLSSKTVESYRERIRKKMNLSTGAELLFFSTSFMRHAARRGVEGLDELAASGLLPDSQDEKQRTRNAS